MIAALVIFVIAGVGIGLWSEFSEQRRVSHMARDFKARRKA